MKIAIAQINPTLGDIKANTLKIISSIKSAEEKGSDIIIFPEMAITGYPPKDLVLDDSFIIKNIEALNEIKKECGNITAVVGFIDKNNGLHNSAAVISGKEIILKQNKTHLPNYDVFDEKRYFKPAEDSEVIEVKV
jgi:NAD+ synthase (glutamine-hydrolysing)